MSWTDHYPSPQGQPLHAKELTEATLVDFISKQVVPVFQKQREKAQFATIILCSKEDCNDDLKAIKYSPSNWQGEPKLDSKQPGMPAKYSDFDNYIAARPHEGFHAEHFLISQLDYLYTSFTIKHNEAPSYIILYTWITPCSSCAQMILDKLSQPPYRDIPRLVAYTTNSHEEGDDIKGARRRLMEAGITVLHTPLAAPTPTE